MTSAGGRPSAAEVWQVLPARPGMVPPVVALRFPGVAATAVLAALEQMVAAGSAIRSVRRGHDVYHRGPSPTEAPARPGPSDVELPLWT